MTDLLTGAVLLYERAASIFNTSRTGDADLRL